MSMSEAAPESVCFCKVLDDRELQLFVDPELKNPLVTKSPVRQLRSSAPLGMKLKEIQSEGTVIVTPEPHIFRERAEVRFVGKGKGVQQDQSVHYFVHRLSDHKFQLFSDRNLRTLVTGIEVESGHFEFADGNVPCMAFNGARGELLAVAHVEQKPFGDQKRDTFQYQTFVVVYDVSVSASQPQAGRNVVSSVTLDGCVHTLAWSPDGQWLALGAGSFLYKEGPDFIVQHGATFRVYDARERELKHMSTFETGDSGDELNCLRFSPDSKLLAAGWDAGNVTLLTIADGQASVCAELGHDFAVRVLDWKLDSDKLLLAVGLCGIQRSAVVQHGRPSICGEVTVWDVVHQKEIGSLQVGDDEVLSLALCPKYDRLAVTCRMGDRPSIFRYQWQC